MTTADMGQGDGEPTRLEGHLNAAEYWLMQADNFEFPNAARTEMIQLAAIHASLAQALAAVLPHVRRDHEDETATETNP
jgi:hypothetical protein